MYAHCACAQRCGNSKPTSDLFHHSCSASLILCIKLSFTFTGHSLQLSDNVLFN